MNQSLWMPMLLVAGIAQASFANLLCADEEPSKVLGRFVGNWTTTTTIKKAELTSQEATISGEEKMKWVLKKKFIATTGTYADGKYKTINLANYDPETKTYYFWEFDSDGAFPRGITTGTWDAEKEQFTISGIYPAGLRGEGYRKFTNKDRIEWAFTVKAEDGTVMMDMSGEAARKQ